MKNGIKVVNLSKRTATVNMRALIESQQPDEKTQKVLDAASLWHFGSKQNTVQDNVPVPSGNPIPTDERYVHATFRALSAIYLPNRGLDFSKEGVLKAAVDLLKNKTVYPNHDFTDIHNWLGVVSNSYWDAAGDKSNNVPGINCEIKLDAFLNYRVACGVMMTPPAINSMSLTVLFEFDFSHPQLVEEKRFWNLLGEEVDGEIVRLIVVKIVDFWEASLVFLGEDRLAKHHGGKPKADDDDDDFDDESLSAANPNLPTNSNEEKTMKLTAEQKTQLGIEFDGEDVPETEILKAAEALAAKNKTYDPANVTALTAKATLADALLGEKRAEVIRLAKISELGAAEGELDEVVKLTIEDANFERLQSLHKYYEKKAAEKFPQGRSSTEDSSSVEGAGGVQKTTPVTTVPTVGLH